MVQLAEKPVFALTDYKQLVYHEVNLKSRVGISHDTADEDGAIWLKIDRLNRIDPPKVPDEIRDWIAVSRDPSKFPVTHLTRTATIRKEEAEQLVARGILAPADVQVALKATPEQGLRDVIYRLDRQPTVKQIAEDYIRGPWTKWAEAEKPRRETIAIYDSFFSTAQTLQSEGTDQPLEIVWGVGIARWRTDGREIDHPLIEQLVELHVDQDNGAITIRPRSAEPRLALKPYFALEKPGADIVFDFSNKFFAELSEDQEFSPFVHKTFEPVLRQCVAHLDKSGCYQPDQSSDITDRSLPEVTESLTVTNTWVIYVRRRSDNFFIADLERLKETIENCENLPGSAKRLVTEPPDEGGYRSPLIDLGSGHLLGSPAGTGGSSGGGRLSGTDPSIDDTRLEDFFFPKQFNDEQVSIIQQLGKADGVVVQGPPGTGKTHTIANIICHYLATGKRVLVTSKGEAALTVLRDHIPEGIRDLVISLLTSEREGLKQLERAVTLLANTAVQMNARQLEKDIIAGQERIIELQRDVAVIEDELKVWARKHLGRIENSHGGAGVLPMELAKKIVTEKEQYAWFPDQLVSDAKPKFTEQDIANVGDARRVLGHDLVYLNAELPSLADLPDTAAIAAIHQDLVNANELERRAREDQLPELSLTIKDALERARKLLHSIEQVIEFHESAGESPWLHSIFDIWRKEGPNAASVRLFNDITKSIENLVTRRTEILHAAVTVPGNAHNDTEVYKAVDRAAKGARPFGLLSFGNAEAKELVNQIRIEGKKPYSVDDWRKVYLHVAWCRDLSTFVARWNVMAKDLGFPLLEDEVETIGRWISRTISTIKKGVTVQVYHSPHIAAEIPQLFPYGIDAHGVLETRAAAKQACDVIKLNLSKHRLGESRSRITDLLKRLEKSSGPVVAALRDLLKQEIGKPGRDIRFVTEKWTAFIQELARIHELRPQLDAVKRVAELVGSSGALRWADSLRTQPVTGAVDPLTPTNWRDSWDWSRMNTYLQEIDGRDRLRQLAEQLTQRDDELKRKFSEVVKLRTYLGLKQNITERVAAALTLFINAIRNIGKGTGIRARRFRRNARDAMEKSYSAVPCWIMPTWRVSESLPAQLGSFDLVIVDEASQSDISALPALLRGKKLLIVGDDKQVSPMAPFVEERKILQLQHNYLKNQPFAPALLPGGSLYTLAQAMFPAQRILLREHFRCVEPIIRFSFQFYTEELIPLRVPKASERLDPPLVDVYVANGRKDSRKINVAEAQAIVDEIERVVTDPTFAGRSIGVVSLIGPQQAFYIQSLLIERIGEEAYLRHDIACGDSPTFQGKERDIMFISMVACPQSKSALTALTFQQRFNVALSRARDREYLFRSVTEEMLNPDDLKAKVIRHFRAPMGDRRENVRDLIDFCDSDFERDVFRRLVKLGYRVTPQVKVGAYSIDLVVEGNNDRRLAVELDGEKYHPPEKWAEDLSRQRVLERVGWRFWRCWGSSFALDPEACMEDLVLTLQNLGVEPIGGESAPRIYTEHRVVGTAAPEAVAETAEAPDFSFADSALISSSTEGTSERTRTVPASQLEETTAASKFEKELLVEPGDRVLISYNDEPSRQYTLTLSKTKHDPDTFVINASMPLAQALIGNGQDDEVEIPAGGSMRKVTILKIDRPTLSQLNA